jgi:hypothetical protein
VIPSVGKYRFPTGGICATLASDSRGDWIRSVPKSRKELRAANKKRAYAWVSYMITRRPEEMARVRKYGTPSDFLIAAAERSVKITTSAGKVSYMTFPESLNTSRGQKLLFDVLTRIDAHLKAIPAKAYELLEHVKSTLTHRRSDTLRNLLMVAEAIIHRAASEFKTEVLFAFDSINVWIKTVYGKELGYQTLHKALELLAEANIIRVNEWGKRGNRSRATKIEILLLKSSGKYTSDVDDWLLYSDCAMTAVYRRESVTRQNVLEAAIHYYADLAFVQEAESLYVTEILRTTGLGSFVKNRSDATMTEVAVEAVAVAEEKVNNAYFDRLLGQLVPAMQENRTHSGKACGGISGST